MLNPRPAIYCPHTSFINRLFIQRRSKASRIIDFKSTKAIYIVALVRN
jgi:hypothetical protein